MYKGDAGAACFLRHPCYLQLDLRPHTIGDSTIRNDQAVIASNFHTQALVVMWARLVSECEQHNSPNGTTVAMTFES